MNAIKILIKRVLSYTKKDWNIEDYEVAFVCYPQIGVQDIHVCQEFVEAGDPIFLGQSTISTMGMPQRIISCVQQSITQCEPMRLRQVLDIVQ